MVGVSSSSVSMALDGSGASVSATRLKEESSSHGFWTVVKESEARLFRLIWREKVDRLIENQKMWVRKFKWVGYFDQDWHM